VNLDADSNPMMVGKCGEVFPDGSRHVVPLPFQYVRETLRVDDPRRMTGPLGLSWAARTRNDSPNPNLSRQANRGFQASRCLARTSWSG
jgi:hypothetical protein